MKFKIFRKSTGRLGIYDDDTAIYVDKHGHIRIPWALYEGAGSPSGFYIGMSEDDTHGGLIPGEYQKRNVYRAQIRQQSKNKTLLRMPRISATVFTQKYKLVVEGHTMKYPAVIDTDGAIVFDVGGAEVVD